jgi:hypothetical protein
LLKALLSFEKSLMKTQKAKQAIKKPETSVIRPEKAITTVPHEDRADVSWTIILLCTDKDSFMSQCNPFGDRCKVIEITEEDDFTNPTGYGKVVEALRGENVAIFASLPCTGGSPWQICNKKHPACRRLILKHHKLFGKLFSSLVRLFKEYAPRGDIPILFEWPKCCRYWRLPRVDQFVRRYGLSTVEFDGCAFGLRSCIKREEGKFLRKPWRIVTNIPAVQEALKGHKCPGISTDHVHATTCGKNAKHSQYYTRQLAETIHKAIAKHHESGQSWWTHESKP